MQHQSRISSHPRRRGFVLLAVLVFIMLLSMVTLSLLFRSQSDESASHATVGSEQAWSAAMSGVEEAIHVVSTAAPGSTDWQDDANTFRARPVYNDGADQWYFTVFSPADGDSLVEIRYGLSDEASRVNLNHPGSADLARIPGLSPTLATTLREFLGLEPQHAAASSPEDSTQEPPGPVPSPAAQAPSDPLQVLSATQVIRHGPLATLEELVLAPGFSRALLHGAPVAFNLADPLEPSTNRSGAQFPPEDLQTKRPRGLDQYFTVFSRDPNRTHSGQPRCNLNDENDTWPACDLPVGFSNYVAAARNAKVHLAHPADALEASISPTDTRGAGAEVASGISKEHLPVLLDLFAADKEDGHDGLINVNTASSSVLATLPGVDLPLAESIVSTRTGLSPERRTTIAWLYQEGLVDAAKFKAIAPALTARSTQYRFNVIGYGMPSGRFRVLEAVVDLAATNPRILYLRDITRLGLPISLKEENPADPNAQASHPIPLKPTRG